MERPSKKPRLADEEAKGAGADADGRPILPSLTRSISPVEQTRQITKTPDVTSTEPLGPRKTINSPFTLTRIRDLPPWANVHVVSLRDILGDPLISECWEFNYLHDVDFLMSAFDQDVKDLVKVHIVHGFWKEEDPSRKDLHVGFFLPFFILRALRIHSFLVDTTCSSEVIIILGTTITPSSCALWGPRILSWAPKCYYQCFPCYRLAVQCFVIFHIIYIYIL